MYVCMYVCIYIYIYILYENTEFGMALKPIKLVSIRDSLFG